MIILLRFINIIIILARDLQWKTKYYLFVNVLLSIQKKKKK
jgi:hypothetical protein